MSLTIQNYNLLENTLLVCKGWDFVVNNVEQGAYYYVIDIGGSQKDGPKGQSRRIILSRENGNLKNKSILFYSAIIENRTNIYTHNLTLDSIKDINLFSNELIRMINETIE